MVLNGGGFGLENVSGKPGKIRWIFLDTLHLSPILNYQFGDDFQRLYFYQLRPNNGLYFCDQIIKNMDAETITAREMEELQKERREMQQKLKSQEKKLDYFERAKRLEEIPLLQKAFEAKQIADRQFWEQQEKERIAGTVR